MLAWKDFNKKSLSGYIFLALIIFLLDYWPLFVPLKNIFNWPFQSLRESVYCLNNGDWQKIFSSGRTSSLEQENQKLKEERVRLIGEVALLQGLNDENQKLKSLIDFYPEDYHFLPAKVIGRSGDYLIINQGEKAGVLLGQLVVSAQHLVGRITEVYTHEARLVKLGSSLLEWPVLIFADQPDCFSNSIVCQKGRGIVSGQIIKEILREEEVAEGDLVVLLDDPAGILVGRIVQIWESQDKLFKQAKIEKLINPDRLTEVFLIVK
ncbi:MAG: rod shape-determining protein MreC [Candidatus Shapirobacteria bacterium]|nr:rod shape-determining protein MreC [Candidatus Shapirobacteria bacterium]MDD5073898.1 rod shape-determining protein MreC [Candidatus Shapirobacteria bacterium]MDD5481492.1 rod shape-determining protein MreC [Candidatus Shapirobacteria bacterium]